MIQASIRGNLAQFTLVRYPQDDEHRRSDCPDWQGWLIGRGQWRFGAVHEDRLYRAGNAFFFEPYQRNLRVSVGATLAFGLQVYRAELGAFQPSDPLLMWRLANLFISQDLDPMRLDEAVVTHRQEMERGAPPAWLRIVVERLSDSPHELETTQQLSDLACVSPFHLIHTFRRYQGMTISEFRDRRRIEVATAAMHQGKSGSEAAQLAGFYDASHLDRHLRKRVGCAISGFGKLRKFVQEFDLDDRR